MNRIKIFGLLLTGALFFSMVFSSVPAFAQTGTLQVTCVGPSGAPEKDVKVTVAPIIGPPGKDKKSSAAGVAVFDKLNNGAYRVVGRKAGFAPELYEFAVVNNNTVSVTLNLAAGAERKFYFEDPELERQANVLLGEGIKAIESGNAAEAEKLLAQAREIKPLAADILYYYGAAQANQGKFEQALESLKKAEDVANLMLSAMTMPKPGGPGGPPPGGFGGPGGPPPGGFDGPPPGGFGGPGGPPPGGFGGPPGGPRRIYEMISQNAAQQINLIPVMKAEAAYSAKRFDEAVTLYDEAIKVNPQNPALYSNKALVLAQSGKLDEALAAANKALEIDPGNERAGQVKKIVDAGIESAARENANNLLNEGNKLLDSDASAALKKFEEANVLTGQKQALIWRQIGRARAKLKQDPEAVAAFKSAIEFAPADQLESYSMSLAQYYLDTKRPEEALDIVVADSKNPEQRLMELFTKTKNSPDLTAFATASLGRIIKLNPANLDAVFELGQIYYMEKEDGQARELLTKYVEKGNDETKVQRAKDFLSLIARRNKDK